MTLIFLYLQNPSKPLSKYEFSYKITHDEGAEQGHQSSNEGVKSTGQYYVNLAGGERQTVNYVADENGFHPHYSFKTSASESHFKSGAQVKPLNLSDPSRYEINIESQNGKIKSLDDRDSYATSPSLTVPSSTESILFNEVNTALPSSVTQDILKLSKPEGTVYTPSILSSASTESVHYEYTEGSSSPSPVTNASPSSSTRNIEEYETSVRHIIQDPNLPQSPLFVSSSERFLTTSSEKAPLKVYPSTPGSATTVSNVFYVNAQSNYNSTTAMLEGFESYLKDYLNANEVKSNDIDSNFKVISDKTELDRLIKQSGTEYEIIKLSDIMAEKKRKEKLALESTTPGYQQTQNIYTQIPSTHNTPSMTITTATDKISSETPGLMKYFEGSSESHGKYRKASNLENENLNSFVDKNTDPDSATSLKSSISQQFAVNYGEKTFNKENSGPNRNAPPTYNTVSNEEKVSSPYNQPSSRYTIAPSYNTKLPYQNTAASGTFVSSTENYLEVADNVEAYRGKGQTDKNEEKEIMSGNQFTYYQNLNAPLNQGQEQIYFKELEVQNANTNNNAQILYSNLPLKYLGGVSPNAFYSQLQNNINEKQTINYNPYPSNPSDSTSYQTIPVSYTTPVNLEHNGNVGQYRKLDTRYQPSTVSVVPNSPSSPNTEKPSVVSEDNHANESPKIVFLSNGETGHIVKSINNLPEQNNVNSAVTISDIEAAKVDQLHVTTSKTVSKKDIDNNKLDEGVIEKQNIQAIPSYTTTIEVFKSVPVEQYVIPDGAPIIGAVPLQKAPPQQYQVGQNVYQGQTAAPNNNIPYPIEQGVPVQKTRLQPVYSSQGQRQSLFRPDPNYSREQKYYTNQIEDTKTPYNIQEPVPIPLNYGLKEYPTGHLAYRTPLSHQLQSIQQYGVPQYSVFTSPLSTDSMAVVHPSYSISVNPLPLHQIQQQMVSNSVPYASQFYPHYIPSDLNISQPNLINPAPPVNPPVKYYQPEKSIASEINIAEPYYYPKPLHNPFEYPAKPAYNKKTRLVPVAHHFNIPTTVLHLVRTPYKSTLSKLAKSTKYNPNESYYLKEMYNYAPQYSKENYHYDGHNPQFQETMHYDGRSKHAPFRPSFPMYDSVYPPMAYYETQYMAPNDQQYDQISNNNNNNNYRRPHIRSIRRPSTSGTMKKLTVEYGGFKPPMVPSTEIKEGDVKTSSTEK
ncbi:hypothetical protein WDU94_008493 [Cyamophila willieti]